MEDLKKFKKELRSLIADYMSSEGCSCCQGENHKEHEKALAEKLNIRKYSDGSGYNFSKYRSEK